MSESSDAQDPIRQAKLEQVLVDYLHSLESAQPVDRLVLISAHPDLPDDRRSFFRNRDSCVGCLNPRWKEAGRRQCGRH